MPNTPEEEALHLFLLPLDHFHVSKYKEFYNKQSGQEKQKFKQTVEKACNKYFELDEFKKGNKNTNGYAFCCEWFKLCPEGSEPFYKQTWFFITCGGVGLLLILGIGVGVFICLRRRKGKSGGVGKSSGGGGGGKGKK